MDVDIPRVAILVQGTEEYGVGQVALTLATELRGRGGKPEIVAFERGALTERCHAEGISCRLLDLPPWPRYVRSKWRTVLAVIRQRFWLRHASRALSRCLRDLSAESLVVQWPTHVELAGKSAQLAGIPCHWMMPNVIRNSWPLGMNRRFYRLLCRRLHVTPLPNSQYTSDSLGTGVGATVVYLGVDENRFRPKLAKAFTRSDLGLPQDACVAGIFARIDPSKGQEPFWQAMVELIKEGHDLHLLLVGGLTDGPFAKQLRDIADGHGFAPRLHFAGRTDEPERYYDAIDFAVNATLIPEGFGLSVVEAMLMGRPVLVHALGGPAETVLDGVTGWHVPEGTIEAFAAGLRRVMRDRAKWVEMGEAAQRRALENFSASAFVSNYRRVLDRNTGPDRSPN